ncbi:hypothetical protein Pint_19062 [Pistacia integerrima]|uniref:Uncharacterized protein n=1 Tax=Pistacia integerrima TaxID=434235 RepID=A0ACC0YZA4_9ROSI|nr:hypothetical protein Pint_19062 [Pistacia integerrima]
MDHPFPSNLITFNGYRIISPLPFGKINPLMKPKCYIFSGGVRLNHSILYPIFLEFRFIQISVLIHVDQK